MHQPSADRLGVRVKNCTGVRAWRVIAATGLILAGGMFGEIFGGDSGGNSGGGFGSSSVYAATGYDIDLVARQFETVDGVELDLLLGVALNERGTVGYTAVSIDNDTQQPTGSGLLIDSRRVVFTGDVIPPGTLGFIGSPALSGNGTIAYSADVFTQGSGLSNTAAVVGDPSDQSTHQLLAGRGTIVEGVTLDGALNPAINNRGVGGVAYTGVYFDSDLGIDASGIVHNGGFVLATGDTIGNGGRYVVDIVNDATLNNRGDLGFKAVLIDTTNSEPSTAIVLNGELAAISGALTDGRTLTEVFAPSVNQPGDLAYVGKYIDPDSGIDSTAIIVNGRIVISTADTASNGMVIDRIEDVAINASGQLAFLATFFDPQTNTFFDQGVFLTRRTPIPEPTSAVILGLTTMMLTKRRSRRVC